MNADSNHSEIEKRIVAELADLTARQFVVACGHWEGKLAGKASPADLERDLYDSAISDFESAGEFLLSLGILESEHGLTRYKMKISLSDVFGMVVAADNAPSVEDALARCLGMLGDYADPSLPLPTNESERLQLRPIPWPFIRLAEDLIQTGWMESEKSKVIWTPKIIPTLIRANIWYQKGLKVIKFDS